MIITTLAFVLLTIGIIAYGFVLYYRPTCERAWFVYYIAFLCTIIPAIIWTVHSVRYEKVLTLFQAGFGWCIVLLVLVESILFIKRSTKQYRNHARGINHAWESAMEYVHMF